MTKEKAEIGIFGGTGIYDSGMLQDSKEITMDTPYGKTSDSITIGNFHGTDIAFMPYEGSICFFFADSSNVKSMSLIGKIVDNVDILKEIKSSDIISLYSETG